MESRSQKRRFNLLTIKKKRLAPIVWALTQQTNLTMEPFADRFILIATTFPFRVG